MIYINLNEEYIETLLLYSSFSSPLLLYYYCTYCMCLKLLQLCLTLCDPMDSGPPGSSVYGILQARILKWVAMPSSRGSS